MVGPEGYRRAEQREKHLEKLTILELDSDTEALLERREQCRRDSDDVLTREEIEDRREREYLRWLTR